jgi:hypothetical protein
MKIYIKNILFLVCSVLILGTISCSTSKISSASNGFENIFDGKSLIGWEGDPVYWRVENGNLVGEVTPSTILDRNSFIIWKGGLTKDFEFKAEYRISGDGNSGINYRSEMHPDLAFALVGYQCDIDGKNRYTGMNYEERKRTTLANAGKIVVLESNLIGSSSLKDNIKNNQWTPRVEVGDTGDINFFKSQIKSNDWNSVHIIVKGNRMQHFINGNLMSDVTDNDLNYKRKDGFLGVQVHVGPPMKIEYRNMRIKTI